MEENNQVLPPVSESPELELRERKKTLFSTIRNISIDEEIFLPIERLRSIRTYCSYLALTDKMLYTTKSNRDTRLVSVKRIK